MTNEFTVDWSLTALRRLRKMGPHIATKIYLASELLSANPRPPKARLVVGFEELWRIRVGDYRIVYQIVDDKLVIVIITVGHRKNVYRGLKN